MKLKGKITAVVLGVAMAVSVLAGCGSGTADDTKQTGQAQQKENKEEAGGLRTVSIQIDGAAVPYYAPLYMAQEKGYFNRMIAGNISQTLTVDSIQGNFNSYPYEMKTYSRQHIIRSSSVTERSLVTTCRLRNVTRSDNNPQGFLIEGFTIVENKDIGQYER